MLVDCATLTPERMQAMAREVEAAGGQFLEAPVSGSKAQAEGGSLIFLAAGDKAVQEATAADMDAMGKATFYLGNGVAGVGGGSRMKLVVNMVMGVQLSALAEGVALAEAAGLDAAELVKVLDLGAMSSPLVRGKGAAMAKRQFAAAFPLKHQQKDMRFAVALGDEVGQSLPCAAAANEQFKRARKEHGDSDFSAVVETCRANRS